MVSASSFCTCERFAGDLPRDALDEPAILLQPGAPFLELLDGAVVLVPHLRDRIGLPEEVGDLVDLRHERGPELVKNHGVSFDTVLTMVTS